MLSKKYRPFKFSDVVGQDFIISELKKRSINMNYNDVLLFSGPSGVGKSTAARIVAALLNDPNPLINPDGTKDPNPESPSSRSILEERFDRDVHFFDASTMGKEEMIKLKGFLSMAPMYDKNKIIIMDEAQALTSAGKGIALDLLEKKRKNIYLILCTMDIRAFDKALVSRCTPYYFRYIKPIDIGEYLINVLDNEGLLDNVPDEFIDKGIFAITENVYGSIRSALQILDRVILNDVWDEKTLFNEFALLTETKTKEFICKLLKKDKSFFNDIKDLEDSKFLYYKLRKVMMGAAIYCISGYAEQSWMKAGYDSFLEYKEFDNLLNVFAKTDEKMTFFSETTFFMNLLKYYRNKPEKINDVLKSSTPRRRVIK